ncbi:MAG: N-acetylglucosaminyldiphosphoundecaprenol N-acetyl-beta-D-mannosaminyltransferase [Verrucomicrobiales bacterium]|jgi:N-acetylglucosaminyldiphosphoundecaprenol N-acetyl-beta-D-mannosaminyltransferase
MQPDRFSVLGVGVSKLNLETAVDRVLGFVEKDDRGYVCVTNVHVVIEAQDDPELKRILNDSLMTTPDGMPLVWVGRHLKRKREVSRVYGPDLMREVFAAGEKTGLKHFFYGGAEGVAEELQEEMLRRFPNSEIVGTYTPPFRPLNQLEEADLNEQLLEAKPDIIWVGLGAPKQEKFMAEQIDKLPCKLMIGVGAAFDFYAGRVRQAPRWMQRIGLEWLFRLAQEPRRLLPRYIRTNPRFLALLGRQLLARRARAA